MSGGGAVSALSGALREAREASKRRDELILAAAERAAELLEAEHDEQEQDDP